MNSTVELLHGGVRGAELEKRELSSPKHIVFHRSMVNKSPSVSYSAGCVKLIFFLETIDICHYKRFLEALNTHQITFI
jgi:hypothetical protein